MRKGSVTIAVALGLLGGSAARSNEPYRPPLKDRGIFSDLDRKVRLYHPSWVAGGPSVVLVTPRAELLQVAGAVVGFARPGMGPRVRVPHLGKNDTDGDGIPDTLDLLLGAKKAALNRAAYRESYARIPYPNGDVPRGEGVCTDVVIRALRNAGLDLQQRVQRDIRARRAAYPTVRKPDPNIDHRRVRTLLVYFRRHWTPLPADRQGSTEPLLPGDVVFLDTMRDSAPEHIGIISDRLGPSGFPLVINNWTVGHRTSEMDLLRFVPVTHRFRLPARPLPLEAGERGPAGLLRRHGVTLADKHRQVLLVHVPLWTSSGGLLQRYARAKGRWRAVGRPMPVRIGSAGLGRGRGLHGSASSGAPVKREGDRRSPAGVFALGTALGNTAKRPYAPGRWPWRATDGRDRLVDDPRSAHYNTWQRVPTDRSPSWRSAEDLSLYRLALLVKHNTDPVQPGAGSAIFLHLPGATGGPTVGCTTLSRRDLIELLRWLDPGAHPVLVQLPGSLLSG